MRRIGVIPGAAIVATWVFMIGFAVGFESELASNPALTSDHWSATATGLMIGAAAVAGVGIGACCVWLVARRRRDGSVATAR